MGFQFSVLAHLLLLVILEGLLYAVDILIVGEVDGFRYVEPVAEPAVVGLPQQKRTFKKVKTKSRGRWFTLNTGMPAWMSSRGSTSRMIFSRRFFFLEFS